MDCQIVTRESASLGIPGEIIEPLNADHSNIVRFQTSDDQKFNAVVKYLQQLLKDLQALETPKSAFQGPNPPTSSHLTPAVPLRTRVTHFFARSMGKFFVGRQEELEFLSQRFLPAERPVSQSVGLFGPAGVGKTQLALKYAVVNRAYYDYVLFLDASSDATLRNGLAKLHVSLQLPGDSSDAVNTVTSWLSTSSSNQWLIIFDNANNLEKVQDIISSVSASGHMLLTTQDARIGSSEIVQHALPVSLLSSNEAEELLIHRAQLSNLQADEVEVAVKLVHELGLLPLAIDNAGAQVRHKTVQEVRDLFRTEPADFLSDRPELTNYPRSLLASLEMNFKVLGKDSSLILSLFACLQATEISEEFLHRGTSIQPRWGRNGEKEMAPPEENSVSKYFIDLVNETTRFNKAMEELTSFSLVQCTGRGKFGRTFALHPLTHLCAKLRMTNAELKCATLEAVHLASQAYPTKEFEEESGQVSLSLCELD